jgi:hypothetical protein
VQQQQTRVLVALVLRGLLSSMIQSLICYHEGCDLYPTFAVEIDALLALWTGKESEIPARAQS